MKQSKNILTEKEMELVQMLMQDCKSTGDIQSKLKRLFAEKLNKCWKPKWVSHKNFKKDKIFEATALAHFREVAPGTN